jgi:hypothetical protein
MLWVLVLMLAVWFGGGPLGLPAGSGWRWSG